MLSDVVTLDFETEAIDGHIPPEPVGLAIKYPGQEGHYFHWGHPDSTNREVQLAEAKDALFNIFRNEAPVLFHNAKFDLGVAAYHWGLAPKHPTLVHDTMFLLFLSNPYQTNLSLKPSSEELLNMPPEEQDAVADWVMSHGLTTKRSEAGAYIARVPAEIVGPYAIGDVERTWRLFELLYPRIVEQDMLGAYQREQKLLPILYESEQRGVRVDRARLEKDLDETYEPALVEVEERIRSIVGDVDVGKKEELADALEAAGLIGEWVLTPTGKRSTAKDNLEKAVNDPTILHLMQYRSALATTLQTFGRPWMEDSAADGRLHPYWNQVRTRGSSHDAGTRTGRMSCNRPNLMNVPNELKVVVPEGMPEPPWMRRYLLPEEGHVWIKRDFSAQEIRILAHFEDGALMQAFINDPHLDPHAEAIRQISAATGQEISRKIAKIIAFGIIYGMGLDSLAKGLDLTKVEAQQLRNGYYAAFPGVKSLQNQIKKIGSSGNAIRTSGGRVYYSEPPIITGGRMRRFDYKLLNYLIQGSAADETKQSMIDWWEEKDQEVAYMAAVHDEINASAPAEDWERHMVVLRQCMNRQRLDLPMESEGFHGANWFELEECA